MMTQAVLRPHDQLTHDEFSAISKAVHEFEALWRQTRDPAIAPFLPDASDPLRLRLLIELLRIDQEHRWEQGEHRLLEQYLQDWPELADQAVAIQELLDAECLTRFCLDDSPTREELRQRFPQFADAVDLDRLRATALAEKGEASTAKAGGNDATMINVRPQVGDELPPTTSFPAKSETSAVLAARRIGLLTGKQFGRYEVRRLVGTGGMGAVYEARDKQLDRIVALKIPRSELVNDPVILQRFLNEARAAGAIRHPHICPIYDVGQLDGQHFITMPLVEGMSLSAWMEHRTVSLHEAAEITRKLASALQAIHSAGIRHRDIKASNVMIDERGEPLLMDFGLARLAQADTHVTQSGSLVGTPAYMAPEQIQLGASGGDERSDLYSLGVLLYQMLTGRLPFEGPMTKVLVDIATKDPPRLETLRSDVDPNLAAACRKAMAREPAQRFRTANEFEDALTNCLRRLETLTRPESQPTLMPTTKTDDAVAVGWDKLAASAGPPEAPRKIIGGLARRSAAGPTLRRRTLIAAALFFVLAAVIVVQISDRAELVIKSKVEGLEVKVIQLAQPEQERTLTIGENSVRVRSGQVEVVLTGANADEYEVVGDKITLKRFGREVVEIKRRETKVAAKVAESLRDSNAFRSRSDRSTLKDGTGWHGWSADAPPPAIAPFDAEQAKQHQEAWAAYLKVPVEYTNSLGMKFRLIPPGEFLMGSTAEEIAAAAAIVKEAHWMEYILQSEAPRHKVILTEPIYLGMHEVTQAEYEQVMGTNPSYFAASGMGKEKVAQLVTNNHPVEIVAWNDAAEFCARLSQRERLKPHYFRAGETVTPLAGTGYRLPGEAEWEFACRAGSTTRFWIGDKDEDLIPTCWHLANSGRLTHPVGELKANPFGLTDMHGNVSEWVQDGWDSARYGRFRDQPAVNPVTAYSPKTPRVTRGGSFAVTPFNSRSALRVPLEDIQSRYSHIGFRVALPVDAVKGSLKSQDGAAVAKKGWHDWPTDAPHPAIAPFDAEQAKQHQEAWARYLNVPVEYTNSIGIKFRLIPPGEFLMGSTQAEIDNALKDANPSYKDTPGKIRSEGPQHKVILTQPLYVGVHEVTQADYERVTGKNPSQFSKTGPQTNDNEKDAVEKVSALDTANHPVERVSWNDAAEFCALLSKKEKLKPFYFRANETVTILEGTGYRLPTEAEWEYSCRAGTTTTFWAGSNADDLFQAGWILKNSGKRTHAVGELRSNPFGLFDVHGNVAEWVQDGWELTYFKQFQGKPAINPVGPQSTSSNRVIRGGYLDSYWDGASMCRASARDYWGPTGRDSVRGFRVSLTVDAVRQAIASGNLAGELNRERDAAWWALTMGGEVTVEVDGATKTLTSVDQLPTQDFSVVGVYVHRRHKAFEAESLEKLVGLPRLHVLRLAECPEGDALAAPIGRLTGLLHLELQLCQMTDAGLERLQNLSKLEYLALNHQPGITDRGLAVVRGMPRLTWLNLTGASISDQGLQALRELPLARLYLDGTKVTDAGLKSLASLKSLTHLYLAWCAVSDDGLAQLQSLEKLHTLSLSRRLLTDRGFEHLSVMQSLRNLHIGDTKVTADDVASLQKKLPNCKITADLAPSDSPKPTAADLVQWIKQVASRSADGQMVEVVKKLRELNPEFDGNFSHKVEKGAVAELLITNAHILDISPLQALPELKTLRLAGSNSPNQIGQLIDLSPLAGMKLTSLDCSFTRVKDLSPLKGMKLTKLHCGNTEVDDLSPLAGMPLTDLVFGYTKVSDLSPLKGMPLTRLSFFSTPITDLSDLRGLPLTELVFFHNTRVTDLSPLEGMKLTVLDCFTTGVQDLSPLKGMPLTFLQCANTKVSDLSPLEGMPLTGLYCFSTQVEDLSPLKGMPLKSLLCNRTRVNDDALKHLSGLTELEKLDLAETKVSAAGVASLRKALPNCKITVDLAPSDSPKPADVAKVPSASVWDLLDAAQIPTAERIPEQPTELVAVLGEHRQRHAGGVASVAIRPDGKQFVTVARDGLRFWDATTFQQTSHFRPQGYERSALAYLPQRKQLVVGGEGNLGQIWNLDEKGISNDAPVSLPRGTSTLPHTRFLAVSPDEKWLMRCREHFKVHLSLMSLAGPEPTIVAEYPDCRFAALSSDSRLLAILRDDDKTIRVLELGDGAPVERHVLKTESDVSDDRPSKGFQQLVFLADGRLATADNNGRTWFWNLKGDQPQILFSTKRADQFLHAAQQAPIVVTAESGVSSILRIDADQAVLKHHATWTEFGRPDSNLTSFAIFPDGRTAISGHLNGAIRFWDITGEKAVEKHPIALQPVASPYVDLAMLPGVVATRDEENHLRLWQPTANGLVEDPATKSVEPQKYLPITSSRDGRLLVTRPIWDGPGCTVWQWDGQKLAPQLSVGRGGAWSAAISSDNRRLAIGYRGTIDLWDITARPPRLEKTLKATDSNGAAYQSVFAKEDTLLIAKMGQTQTVWNLTQDDPLPEQLFADRNPFLFAVSPTRDLLAVDGGGTQLLGLQHFPPQPFLTLKSGPNQFGSLAFSSDGKQLAVTDDLSVDRSIIDVHDTETGVRKHRITLPMPLRRLSFTDDNRHLVTTNANGTIYVLRLEAKSPSK